MASLVDSNILLRLANSSDVQHQLAVQAIAILQSRQELLCVTPQNLIEFWNGATRPRQSNGLGLSPEDAARETAKFETAFLLLPDIPAIYPAWKYLVDALGVSGKQVHDTRLVAVCHVHGISHLLTFNGQDFLRFQSVGTGLVIVDPRTV